MYVSDEFTFVASGLEDCVNTRTYICRCTDQYCMECTKLPVDYYAKRHTHQFDTKLFEKLVPSNTINILQSIGRILPDKNPKCGFEIGHKLIQQLVQQLKQVDLLSVSRRFTAFEGRQMYVNNELVMLELYSFKGTYLISLLLLHLNWNIVSTPEPIDLQIVIERDIQYVHAINYIWDSYQHQPKVKALLTLCIQQARKHMNSLTDNSFMSLPVPSCIR